MESMRTKCFQANTCHRVAVKPFEFSDGHTARVGDAVEFNQHAVLSDAVTYPNPKEFDPGRFLNKGRSVVDTGIGWPFWGVPRMLW